MLKPLRQAIQTWIPHEGALPPATDPLAILGAAWEELVGPEVARNSRPVQIVGDALVVATRSSAWSQQLSFLAPHALEAIRNCVPTAPITQLRFRIGRWASPASSKKGMGAAGAAVPPESRPARDESGDALERFRADVEANKRAKRDAGWKECMRCGVHIPPGRAQACAPCRSELQQARAKAVARLLYEAPGIDYADATVQIEGLSRPVFEAEKRRLLSRWRVELERVARDGRLSRNGRERLIASSYVLLKTGISPERIAPATIRNELGDTVYDLIYGMEQ